MAFWTLHVIGGLRYISDWLWETNWHNKFQKWDLHGQSQNGLRWSWRIIQVSSRRNYKTLVEHLARRNGNYRPKLDFSGSLEVSSGSGSVHSITKTALNTQPKSLLSNVGAGTLQFKTGEIISGIWNGNVNKSINH